MLKRILVGSMVALVCMASSMAVAVPPTPWYAGAGVGSSHLRFQNNDFSVASNPAFSTVSESHDSNRSSTKVFVGYTVSPNLAVEAAYLDFGKYQYHYTDAPSGSASDTVKLTGFNFSLVGSYPIFAQTRVFGKVGAFVSKEKNTSTADNIYLANYAPYPVGTTKSTRTIISSGVGIDYAFSDHFSVRGEYEFFQKTGSAVDANNVGTGRVTPSMATVSLVYNF